MDAPPRQAGVFDAYRSRVVMGAIVTFTITSTISIILRLVAKRIKKMRLSSEDWIILIAQVAVYGMATCSILEIVIGGAGHHVSEVPLKVSSFLKVLVAMQCFYGMTLGLIKVSICLFYKRIFQVQRPFRIACSVVVSIITAWAIMVFLSGLLLCQPLAFNWDPTIPGGKCANQRVAFIVIGVLDLVVDVMVLVLPIPLIWNLQVSLANKIALFAIFGLGICTMIISILRIQSLLAVSYTDITYTAAYPLLWSFSEPAIGISVACAPLLRPIFRGRLARLFTSRDTTKSKDSGKSNFHRLEEEGHPLSSLPPNRTVVTGGKARNGEAVHGEDEIEMLGDDRSRHLARNGIKVRRDWTTERL